MNLLGIGAVGLLAAGARFFSSASNVLATTIDNPVRDPAFLPLQAVQAAARGSGIGASTRRFPPGDLILRPIQPGEMSGGLTWSAGDLGSAFVSLSQAANAFKVNLAIVRTADEMQKQLIDIKA